MLAEELVDTIDCEVLQVNTDGLTIRYNQTYENIVKQICKDWEKTTNLELEYKLYKKMIIQDVNNYAAQDIKGNIKSKGLFLIEREAHQDTSFKIVPIALSEYFINNIPIKETIENHKNIYNFCARAKFKSDSYGECRYIEKDGESNFQEIRQKQQKTTRYYISKKGSTFIKVYPEKAKESFINKGFQVTIFNRFVQKEDYLINHQFYINECQKIIESIQTKQLTLL